MWKRCKLSGSAHATKASATSSNATSASRCRRLSRRHGAGDPRIRGRSGKDPRKRLSRRRESAFENVMFLQQVFFSKRLNQIRPNYDTPTAKASTLGNNLLRRDSS